MNRISTLPVNTDTHRVQPGPYKATQLWNDAIQAFRNGMPTGRRRRYMKSYESCFIASAAVDWLHNYLLTSPGFAPNITRKQSLQLLEKFYQVGVIEDVKVSKKEQISDNGRLFRFNNGMTITPLPVLGPLTSRSLNGTKSLSALGTLKADKKLRPLSVYTPRNDAEIFGTTKTCNASSNSTPVLQDCVPVLTPSVVTTNSIEQVWTQLLVERLQMHLHVSSIDQLLDAQLITAQNIIHNTTQINKNGVVTNIDVKEQLPTWIVSAMRCLAYWPDRVVDTMPSYPGFEVDVFKVVRDHLLSLKEPLLTSAMYEVFTNVFSCAERGVDTYQSSSSLLGLPQNKSKAVTTYASVENLMMDITIQGGSSQLDMHTPSKRAQHTPHSDYRGMYWSEMQLNQNNNNPNHVTPSRINCSTNNLNNRHTYGGYTLGGDCGLETSFGLDGGEPRTTRRSLNTVNVVEPRITHVSAIDSGVPVDLGYSSSSQTSTNVSPPMNHHGGNNNGSPPSHRPPCTPHSDSKFVSLIALESCYGTDEPFSTEYSCNNKNNRQASPHGSKCLSMDDVHSVAPTPENQLLKMARVYDWANSVTKETTSVKPRRDPATDLGSIEDLHSSHLSHMSNKECARITDESSTTTQYKSMQRSKSMGGRCNMMSSVKSELTQGLTPNTGTSGGESIPAHLLPRELQERPTAPPPYVPPPSYMRATGPKKMTSKSYSSLASAQKMEAYNRNSPSANDIHNHLHNHAMAESYCLAVGGHSMLIGNGLGLSKVPELSQNAGLRPGTDVTGPGTLFSGQEKLEHTADGSASMKVSRKKSDTFDMATRTRIQRCLQLCCLLLPPANRRKLHLLLRLMYKMSNNPKLSLLPGAKVRSIVIQAFTPCIIRPHDELGSTDMLDAPHLTPPSPSNTQRNALCERIVTFLMDNYAEVLNVPEQFHSDMKVKLAELGRPRVKVAGGMQTNNKMVYDRYLDDRPLTFCEQVSGAEYKKQGLSVSQGALVDLLDNIIEDQKMSSREKKKKLKQFQRSHPDIFSRRLPCSKSESDLRVKTPLLSRPLQKLKNIRN